MPQDLTRQLVRIAKVLNVQFSLKGNPISFQEVFTEKGLLPGLARRADQLCSLCLGYGIGVKIEQSQGTLLGIKATFDDITPEVLRYLCITDVLCDLIRASAGKDLVSLDALLYD